MLDGVCLSHLANDETDRTFPSLNIGMLLNTCPRRYIRIQGQPFSQAFHSTKPLLIGMPQATSNEGDCPSLSMKRSRYHLAVYVAITLGETTTAFAGRETKLYAGKDVGQVLCQQ